MRAHYQGRRRRHRPQSRPFPWVRLTGASFLTVLFLLGAAFQILSSGNVISRYWLLIIPPLIAVIALLIPLYQYLLPLPIEDTATHTFQTHQPLATHPITDRHIPSETGTPLWNVPYPHNPFFIGREALLTHLYDILHDEKAAALTQAISGLGGIGKTQLAVEYACRKSQLFYSIKIISL
jgi:hypothetical protein